MTHAIEARALSRYFGGIKAADRVTFTVEPGVPSQYSVRVAGLEVSATAR